MWRSVSLGIFSVTRRMPLAVCCIDHKIDCMDELKIHKALFLLFILCVSEKTFSAIDFLNL